MDADVNFQAPIKSVSIENMVRMRAAAVERIEAAVKLLHEVEDIVRAANLGMPRVSIVTPNRSETPVTAP